MNSTNSIAKILRRVALLAALTSMSLLGNTGCALVPGAGAGLGQGGGAGGGQFDPSGAGLGGAGGGQFDPSGAGLGGTGGLAGAGGGLGTPGAPGTTPGLGSPQPVGAPPAGGRSALEQQVDQAMLQQLNAIRQSQGRSALTFDPRLLAASYAHATDMATKGYFDHTGQDGSSPSTRAARQGYRGGVAENIAMNSQTGDAASIARRILQQYWESPGHKQNMLGNWRICGLGTNTRRGAYNCQMFGN